MEEYKKLFAKSHKLNSLVACTLSNEGDKEIRRLIINKSYINPESTNGLHMMSGTYLYTNPPPYGYGSPCPYVAATVTRSYGYNRKNLNESVAKINSHEIIDAQIPEISDFPKTGIVGNFNPSLAWVFSQNYLVKNFCAIIECAEKTIDFLKNSNSDVLSKGRQTWDPETLKSTTCSKAFNGFLKLIKRNLDKTPSTLMETLIYWYELYNLNELKVLNKIKKTRFTKKFVKNLKMRVKVTSIRFFIKMTKIVGKENCNRWLDDYARSFCSYIKHAERGKKDRRAIASGSVAMRLHLKVIEEFHLKLARMVPGSTISIGGEEKKKKIVNELQMSSLKENMIQSFSLQATEDATKWNECLNPLLFELVNDCWFNDDIRKRNNLPPVTPEQLVFKKICSIGHYYLLIKRINLGIGFLLENETFYTRLSWFETKLEMLSPHNQIWYSEIVNRIDKDDYIASSPGFLMGMLNAASTTMGLIAISGIEIPNTIIRSLRSSDDSMTVFVASEIPQLAVLIGITYSAYRLFGINPSREKTILFPESFGEYTSWYQDKEFVGQYGVETSSLKPGGKNPQDDFNSVAANTLQLMRTHIINVIGAISRIAVGIDNVRKLWNIKIKYGDEIRKDLNPKLIFLSDGGLNIWVPENLSCDEATLRFKNISTDIDRKYFSRIMEPENPFSEPPEEQLLFNKDVGLIVSNEDTTPRNVFCYVRRSNRTNRQNNSETEAKFEKSNQEAFEIATTIDPSFLLTIPCSKTNLNRYLASTLILLKEKMKEKMSETQISKVNSAVSKLIAVRADVDVGVEEEYEYFDEI